MPLSGPAWVSRFPTSRSVDDLAEPFRTNVRRFIAALQASGATVSVADTLRPPERAYLMHFSFAIAREDFDPALADSMPGVDIQWVHPDSPTVPSRMAAKDAAELMVQGYQIAFKPVLTSRHTEALAIDMSISWTGTLVIARADARLLAITATPRTGDNTLLHAVGASYGVIKLVRDPPHWSVDGH